MEAILSYMYTGKVKDIEKIAYKLLPVAEEYGLVRLWKMCEEALARSLKSSTAIITLMYASAHNASDLKKACMEFQWRMQDFFKGDSIVVARAKIFEATPIFDRFRDNWLALSVHG